MASLSYNTCLPDYTKLAPTFDVQAHLVPPPTYPQNIDGKNVYIQYIRSLLQAFLSPQTMADRKAPYKSLKCQENSIITCCFKLLFITIKHMSPQIGGITRSLQYYVSTLRISDG